MDDKLDSFQQVTQFQEKVSERGTSADYFQMTVIHRICLSFYLFCSKILVHSSKWMETEKISAHIFSGTDKYFWDVYTSLVKILQDL